MRKIRIVIIGGGKVGSFLAVALARKDHQVVVIEKNEELCRRLAAQAPAVVIHGDGCDLRYQEEAEVSQADVFAAVTGDDDDNLVACQLAKTYFGVPRTVARVNNPKNEPIFNKLGIDAISSTTVIAQLIEERTTVGEIITLHTMKKGKMAMVELDIPERGSGACDRPLRELGLPAGCVLVSIIRGEEVIIPHGSTRLRPGDTVIAVTELDKEKVLKDILVGKG